MQNPKVYAVISSHGFGHAARTAHMLSILQKQNPQVDLILNTSVPRNFFERILREPFEIRNNPLDFGIIQSDGITIDLSSTSRRLRELIRNQENIISEEVSFIRSRKISFIFGDIPFLVPDIAKRSGTPFVLMGNFGWDFIYSYYGGEFSEFSRWVGDCYSKTDLLLRLPFHEEMSAFPRIHDCNLVGGYPRYSAEYVKEKLNINGEEGDILLITFGGMGLNQIPFQILKRFNGADGKKITFLIYENIPPKYSDVKNIRSVGGHSFNPVDIMQICSGAITKPGYGMLSEALRVNCPLYVLDRKNFRETPILISSLKKYFIHSILSEEDFFHSEWNFLDEKMKEPLVPGISFSDGNEEVVQIISAFL